MSRISQCQKALCETKFRTVKRIFTTYNGKNVPACSVCNVTFIEIEVDFSKNTVYRCPCCRFKMRTIGRTQRRLNNQKKKEKEKKKNVSQMEN